MRQFMKNKKMFVITLALVIGIAATSATMAILHAQTGTISNLFSAGDVNTHIDEDNDDQPVKPDTNILKSPVIVNDGPSNAFIRARITVSPSTAGVELFAGSWSALEGPNKTFTQASVVYDGTTFSNNGKWIYYANDGYYYYTLPVEVGASTTSLFDAVVLKESADVTIYQEAVLADSSYALDEEVDVMELKELFDSVTDTESN